MRLEDITPVVLTFNEEANIGRTLERLQWARKIVVVDAFSTDRTHEIVTGFDNTLLVTQLLEHHADKWHFALQETDITTEWVLRLDADYLVTDEFVDELRAMEQVGWLG